MGAQAACLLCPGSRVHALARSHGWRLLAALPQLLRVDISALDGTSSRLDSAVAVCFGPAPPGHLLVSTSSNTVVVLDTTSGRMVREVSPGLRLAAWPAPPFWLQSWCQRYLEEWGPPAVAEKWHFPRREASPVWGPVCSHLTHENALLQLSGVHPTACPSLALSRDGRFLLTAADRAIKVWDYLMQANLGCQVCAVGSRVAGRGRVGGGRCPGLALCPLGPDAT